MSATAMKVEQAAEVNMKALIIYGDVALATQAKAMLERASERADATTRWDVKPWRMDLLMVQGMGNAALKDGAGAHLIVFAVPRAQALPGRLADWLEQWATCREVQEAAVAVFDGGNSDTLSVAAAPELSLFAERQGLSFILGDVGPTEEESGLFVPSTGERAAAWTPTLGQILEHSGHGDYAHWGINE